MTDVPTKGQIGRMLGEVRSINLRLAKLSLAVTHGPGSESFKALEQMFRDCLDAEARIATLMDEMLPDDNGGQND